MVAWSICNTLMGVVHNFGGLITARIFLGLTEGGLFPGVAFYITVSAPSAPKKVFGETSHTRKPNPDLTKHADVV